MPRHTQAKAPRAHTFASWYKRALNATSLESFSLTSPSSRPLPVLIHIYTHRLHSSPPFTRQSTPVFALLPLPHSNDSSRTPSHSTQTFSCLPTRSSYSDAQHSSAEGLHFLLETSSVGFRIPHVPNILLISLAAPSW